jgi:Mg/Co/Ni transporter MgtE
MFDNPALDKRIGIGKVIGLVFGFIGFISIPYFLLEADWLLRWSILLWYTTIWAIIGGLFGYYMPTEKTDE